MCRRQLVSSPICTSRATASDSVAAGIPRRPSRTDCFPSRITAPANSELSSQWSITGKSSARQYSITCRKSFAVAMGRPSSETATIPACFIAAISASASPLLPIDAAPIGHTRTGDTAAARSRIERVTDALSFTGRVFGIGHTAVNPPRAAARVPVSIVSEDSPPGSRRWQCKSIKPGATIRFLASKISAPWARAASCPCGATAAMRSPSSRTSRGASVPLAGSSTRPLLISSMRRIPFRRRVRADHQKQQGHAHGKPVGHLLEHARLRPVGHGGIDFQAANHRPRMHAPGHPACAMRSRSGVSWYCRIYSSMASAGSCSRSC